MKTQILDLRSSQVVYILALSIILLATSPAGAVVVFDWATVGNPGNRGDRQPQGTFGAVDYEYRISKYEVTNNQYVEFLNAVDPTGENTHSLFSSFMSSETVGGIVRNIDAANGLKYEVKSGRGNNPASYVSFLSAMRFTNWLQNGQGSGSTESGVYAVEIGLNETRQPGARYFIPSENEWYKAAYHKNDGATANYWDYPTSTSALPYSAPPPGSGAPTPSSTVNCYWYDFMDNGYNDGYAVTGSQQFLNTENYLTDVGAYSASTSPYGTFDQAGNVREWTEGIFLSDVRILRGGDFGSYAEDLVASFREGNSPTSDNGPWGFRVASIAIPEPSSMGLAAIGVFSLFVRSRRRV